MHKRITDILEEAVRNIPEKIALADQNQSITYKMLRDRSLEIAALILERGRIEGPIIIALPRCIVALETLFAVAYSGNYWLWFDSALPEKRQTEILDQFDDYLIISDKKLSWISEERKYIFVDQSECTPTNKHKRIEKFQAPDNEIMAIIFTSGTTGVPKGVLMTHEGMIKHSVAECGKHPDFFSDVVILFSPYSSGMIAYFFAVMYAGGKAVILPNECFFTPHIMNELMRNNRIRTILCPPSAMEMILEYNIIEDITSLETVILGSSKLTFNLVRMIFKALPKVNLLNAYGASEVYGPVFTEIIDKEIQGEIPIGEPYPTVGYRVIDEERVVKEGKGELYIETPFIARGYYNRPNETGKVFLFDKETNKNIYKTGDLVRIQDNKLFFEGRQDNQIKHLGYRIELEDIDKSIEKIKGIDIAATVYDKGAEKIVLFYTGDILENDLAREIVRILPVYMRPSRCIPLSNMLYNENGKIDRISLLKMINGR